MIYLLVLHILTCTNDVPDSYCTGWVILACNLVFHDNLIQKCIQGQKLDPKIYSRLKNWPKNLFQAKKLTQKFITSYKIDPKIYFPAKKVPSKNVTSCIPIYGSYPPPPPIVESFRFKLLNDIKAFGFIFGIYTEVFGSDFLGIHWDFWAPL